MRSGIEGHRVVSRSPLDSSRPVELVPLALRAMPLVTLPALEWTRNVFTRVRPARLIEAGFRPNSHIADKADPCTVPPLGGLAAAP